MNRRQRARLVEEMLLETYISQQRRFELRGVMAPQTPTRVERNARWLELAGGLELGFVTASMVILINLIVLTLILHVRWS